MLPITLVRNSGFYITQFCIFIIFSVIGCGIASTGVVKINSAILLNRGDYLALFAGVVYVLLAFFVVFRYFKNTPAIRADESAIRFGKSEIYALEDIREIQFTGKVPLPILWNSRVEGTCLILKDGTKKYIYDDLYSNASELKSFLQQTVADIKAYEPTIAQGRIDDADINEIEFFKGNPILSFSPIMLWSFLAFMSFVMFKMAQRDELWIIIVIPAMFIFMVLSSSMNYFGLSDKYFIVKNYHYIWKKHIYSIDNTKEIVFETSPRGPNYLRIITRDFQSKVYTASTLRDKHWLELMDKLQEKGVSVRNECIPVN